MLSCYNDNKRKNGYHGYHFTVSVCEERDLRAGDANGDGYQWLP